MKSLLALAGIAGTLLGGSPSFSQDDSAAMQSLIEKQSPAIVSVRASLKVTVKGAGQAQDQETPMTMQGVLVAPTGLVMVSNLAFSPSRTAEIMGGGRGGFDAAGYKVTPTNIKVHLMGDEKDYDGFLAATDTPLDLAFIQVEGLADRKLPFIDFASAATAGVGQPVYGVARLQKGYDYAPYIQTGRVVGEISKPRKAWMLEGHVSNFGLPVFNASGQPVGALTTLVGGANDEAGAAEMSFSMIMRMMTGGGGTSGGAFVLPSNVVKGLVDQASRRATELAVERAKRKANGVAAATDAKPAAKPPAGTAPKKPIKP